MWRIDPRFLRYLELIDSVIYVIDVSKDTYSPKWVSPNIEKIFGFSVDEALDPTWWWEHIHPEDYEGVVMRQGILLEHRTLKHRYRLRRKDGRYLWVLDKLGFYPFENGQGGEVIGAITDITHEVHLEEKLREGEERFRLAFYTNPDAVIISRLEDGVITDVNDGFCSMFGFSRREVLGRTALDLGIWTEPKERDGLRQWILDRGDVKNYETVFCRRGGQPFTVLLSATLFYLRGVPHVLSVMRDIEELKRINKELERRERMLTDAQRMAKVGCWELDIRENRLWWSDEVYRIFELERDSFEGHYEAFLATVHPDDKGKVDDAYKRSLRLKTPYAIEHRLLFPDGRIKWVEEQCETFFSGDGEPIRSIGTVLDITEKKMAFLALKESEERYRYLFENSPIPLFELDFTDVVAHVKWEIVPRLGHVGLARHLDENPGDLRECVKKVKVIGANKAALTLFEARSRHELANGLVKTFTRRMFEVFRDQIVAVIDMKEQLELEGDIKTLGGQTRDVLVRFSWRSVEAAATSNGEAHPRIEAVVSLTDITDMKRTQECLRQRTHHVEALLRLEKALLEARGLDDIIDVSLGCLEDIIDAQRISIALLDAKGEKVRIYSTGLLSQEIGGGMEVPVSHVYPAMERLMKGGRHHEGSERHRVKRYRSRDREKAS